MHMQPNEEHDRLISECCKAFAAKASNSESPVEERRRHILKATLSLLEELSAS